MEARKNLERVNGALLSRHIGEEVILLGKIQRKSSDGRSIELIATDDVPINVTLNEPLDSDVDGYIEVRGVAQSKCTMCCNYYVLFSPEQTKEFNTQQYNEYVSLANVIGPNKWE